MSGAVPERIELVCGERRFSALSLGEGPVVLCLHGFPDHLHSFRHQLPVLADAGYRAVAPMLRGYEPSSQLARRVADYHPLQLAGDVVAWAGQLGGGEPVHLIGHDWGAVVTYLACGLAPSLFGSATAMAVPPLDAMQEGIRRHPGQLRNSWYMVFFQLRGLADRIVAARDYAFIERLWRAWSPGWAWDTEDMASLKRTFRQPGVLWSALAYYRAMANPFPDDSRAVQRMSEEPIEVPTLTLSGAVDGCMDTRIYDCADPSRYPRGYRFERVPDLGHFLHQENPAAVNPILLDWLAEPGGVG
jgi:pimeloyl-ACP methyl ester carboxylesterase